MILGIKKSYPTGKTKCYKFNDNSKVCMSEKAWSVFFATVNKMGADETKPRPKTVSQEAKEIEIKEWYLSNVFDKIDCDGTPNWVPFAEAIAKSAKHNQKVKSFWQDKLDQYKKKKCGGKI